jgi:hypothetical protein
MCVVRLRQSPPVRFARSQVPNSERIPASAARHPLQPQRCRLRLLYSGILQFFLPSIVDQRAFAGLKGGFSLRNLRPKIFVAQAGQ